MNSDIDPVTLALVQNRLDYISRQMGWVMTRTARSPIFNQSHDFSCFIADRFGTLISQADGIPIHTGGGGFATRAILEAFGDDMSDGDVFLLNDPYVAGGNHLPDWVTARPIFDDGTLIALCCNRAHQSDIGGGAAGTYNPTATEIFHEGLRLPVMKLIDAGETREDLWKLLQLNSRTPELLDGDLRAMIGSTRIGGERVLALVRELGHERAEQCFAGVLGHADRRFRDCVRRLPNGRFSASEAITNDCFEPVDLAIRVTLDIDDDELTVDFSGTDDQIRGFKNSSIANTYSAVYMALASYFEPDLPRNEGTFRNTSIIAPEGSMVNPLAPAPMTMCTVFIAHEIVHAIWRVLGEALPERSCAGWGKSIHGVTAGGGVGQEPFVMYHWNAMPGGGAVEGRDGFHQIGHLIALGGLTLPNIEVYEQLYPVRFKRQELRPDGAGAGEYRGGCGIEYEAEVTRAAEYSFRGEGIGVVSGFGINGGLDGAVGDMQIREPDNAPFEAPPYGRREFGPATVTARSPGGGGWGDPKRRETASVLRDVKDGVVTEAEARRVYGVAFEARGEQLVVDDNATRALRAG